MARDIGPEMGDTQVGGRPLFFGGGRCNRFMIELGIETGTGGAG